MASETESSGSYSFFVLELSASQSPSLSGASSTPVRRLPGALLLQPMVATGPWGHARHTNRRCTENCGDLPSAVPIDAVAIQ